MYHNCNISASKLTPIIFYSPCSTCKIIIISFTCYFHNCTEMLFFLIMLFLSQFYSGVFQRLCGKYKVIAFTVNGICVCVLLYFKNFSVLNDKERCRTFPQRSKLELSYDPEIILLVSYSR